MDRIVCMSDGSAATGCVIWTRLSIGKREIELGMNNRGRSGDGLYRKRGIWYFRIVDWTGKRRAVSTRTTVFSEAQSVRKQHLQTVENGGEPTGSGRLLFRDAAQRWLERRIIEAAPETRRNYKKRLAHILAAFGDLRLGQITGDIVRRYQIDRTKTSTAPSSVNNEVKQVASILRENRLWSRIRDDVRWLKEPKSIGRTVTPDEMERLLKTAESRKEISIIFLVMRLALETGMRHKEIRILRRDSIDLAGNNILVARASTKTPAGERTIPLTPTARQIVLDLLSRAEALGSVEAQHYVFPGQARINKHHVVNPDVPMASFCDAWSTLRKLAHIDKTLRIHDLRHHFATDLAQAGVPTSVGMRLMGWSGNAMRKRYEHIQDTALRQGMDNLTAHRAVQQPMPPPPKPAKGDVIVFPSRKVG